MWLIAIDVAQAVLIAFALLVARTRRSHRPLVAWLALLTAYAYVFKHGITPGLARLPRPYHGAARVALHSSQFLYLLCGAVFVVVAWRAFGERGRRTVIAPFAALGLAMAALVVGYASSGSPGAYRLGSLNFASAAVYTFTYAAFTMLIWAGILPKVLGAQPSVNRASRVTQATVVTIASFDIVRIGLPFVWAQALTWTVVPIMRLAMYAIAIGFHVADLSGAFAANHATDPAPPTLSAVGLVIARLRLRIRFARSRLRRPLDDAEYRHDPTLLYPVTIDLARKRATPHFEQIVMLAHMSPEGAAALETVLIVTGSLPASVAAVLTAKVTRDFVREESAHAPASTADGIDERTAPFDAAIRASVKRIPHELAIEVLELATDLCWPASVADENLVVESDISNLN